MSLLRVAALPVWGKLEIGLKWLWKALWYPAALPIVIWLLIVGFGLKSCQNYNQLVRETLASQDSVIAAQDTELWQLRADTLEAHFQIREMYNRLDNREKQEVLFYSQLRSADDAALQVALDSVYGRHANYGMGIRLGQPAETAGIAPLLSGRNLTAPKFDANAGWSPGSSAKSVPRR
ncbi:hypothetical protein [Spirosoma oryzicola]|uniref:hypothetical protein n=1 Tax=Spirosoma oryzicola TaxID=2898794 RepID=UPI001E2F07A0|nr:hypothetical protein [Spirosoma oryzicola]UHG91777.1 hypothetical protein LQ777_02495 [Spirosoma oryzicola]